MNKTAQWGYLCDSLREDIAIHAAHNEHRIDPGCPVSRLWVNLAKGQRVDTIQDIAALAVAMRCRVEIRFAPVPSTRKLRRKARHRRTKGKTNA
jgi:hypothetical protein